MNCLKNKKLLNFYLDQTLDRDITKQVEEHLKSCSTCQEEYLKLKKIVSALNSISPQIAPVELTKNIMAKISQEEIQIQSSWIDQLKRRISIPVCHSHEMGIYIFFPSGRCYSSRSTNYIFCLYFYLLISQILLLFAQRKYNFL